MNRTKLSLATMIANIGIFGGSASLPQVTNHNTSRKTLKRKGKRIDRAKWDKAMGNYSKSIQFQDPELLEDGRHAYFMQNGCMVRRDV